MFCFFVDEPFSRRATGDFLLRTLSAECINLSKEKQNQSGGGQSSGGRGGGGWSSAKGGEITCLSPSQHVLSQSCINITKTGEIVILLTVNLPARGRSILGQVASKMFGIELPNLIYNSVLFSSVNPQALEEHVFSLLDSVWLRNQLEPNGFVSFIPDGSILPRLSGASDKPLKVVNTNNQFQGGSMESSPPPTTAFKAPPHLRVQFQLPNSNVMITGLPIHKGK